LSGGVEVGGCGLYEAWCRREGVVESLEDGGGLPDNGSFVGRRFVIVRGGWVEQHGWNKCGRYEFFVPVGLVLQADETFSVGYALGAYGDPDTFAEGTPSIRIAVER